MGEWSGEPEQQGAAALRRLSFFQG
jgi:hypothetical protein